MKLKVFLCLLIILLTLNQEITEAYGTNWILLRHQPISVPEIDQLLFCSEVPTGKLVWKLLGCKQKSKWKTVNLAPQYLFRS